MIITHSMPNNIIDFKVITLELAVDDVEEVANIFDEKVKFKKGKFWINHKGEGIEMRFGIQGEKYVLEYINSTQTFSAHNQDKIREMFARYNGKILAERTWEDGDKDDLRVNC